MTDDKPVPKLKAWPIAKQAWKSFAGAMIGLLPLVLVTLALAAALSVAQVASPKLYAILLRPKAEDIKVVSGAIHVGARLAVIFLFSLIVTPLAVAVHRRILGAQTAFVPAARNFFFWLFLLQAAFLSPPVAMSAFYLKGVAPPHVTINQIFGGMMPYMLIVILCMVIMYIWPGMTLWLPNYLYGSGG